MTAGAPGTSRVQAALSALTFESIEMLQTFREENSFLATATALGRDERVVSRRMLELHDTFERNFGIGLLERGIGRRGYALTKAGEILAESLEPVTERAWQAIEGVQRASSILSIPCSSTCLEYFEQLQSRLIERDLMAFTDPRRSSEFPAPPAWFQRSPAEGGAYRLAMYSTAVREFAYEPGTVVDTGNGLKVLVLRVDNFHLLAPRFLDLPKRVSFTDLLERGISMWIPPGGAVMEFTQKVEPGWNKRWPVQFLRTPDLDFGLQCLRRNIHPREAAMIIHGKVGEISQGISEDPFGGRIPNHIALDRHRVEVSRDKAHVALTGLFYNGQVAMEPEEAAGWDEAWRIAQEVMGP